MTRKEKAPPEDSTLKDSASQIWLAGLGAFAKAQEQGGKVFEALVKEGQEIQRKTQEMAEGKLSEASERMASVASELTSRATGQWDRLETMFEARVARALKSLGVPSTSDIAALNARIDTLERTLARRETRVRNDERPTARKTPSARRAASRKAE